jgi:hypothetical protein
MKVLTVKKPALEGDPGTLLITGPQEDVVYK